MGALTALFIIGMLILLINLIMKGDASPPGDTLVFIALVSWLLLAGVGTGIVVTSYKNITKLEAFKNEALSLGLAKYVFIRKKISIEKTSTGSKQLVLNTTKVWTWVTNEAK